MKASAIDYFKLRMRWMMFVFPIFAFQNEIVVFFLFFFFNSEWALLKLSLEKGQYIPQVEVKIY